MALASLSRSQYSIFLARGALLVRSHRYVLLPPAATCSICEAAVVRTTQYPMATADADDVSPCRSSSAVAAALRTTGYCYLQLSSAERRATKKLFDAAAAFHDADVGWKALAQHQSTKRGGYYKAGEEPTYDSDADKSQVEDFSVVSTGDDQIWPEGERGDALRDVVRDPLIG